MSLSSSFKSSVIIAALSFALIVVIALIGQVVDFRWETLLRDSLGKVPWDGLITTIGVIFMFTTAIVAAIATVMSPRRRYFFGFAALFALAFSYDDFNRFHESQIEALVYAIYGLAFLALYMAATRFQHHWLIWPLAVTFGCFAASVLIDLFWDFVPSLGPLESGRWSIRVLVEESFKFAGIVTFAATILGETRRTLPKNTAGADHGFGESTANSTKT